ncbi:MAG: hypothetical protein JW749_01805 [Sedimentisphaerales bacterium]|nr:hypothetical protein [Sedimentisphaerales bacterium]
MKQPSQQRPAEDDSQHIEALLKKYPALAEAARYGVDIGLLLDNLRRPVSERIHRHQAALNAMNQLRKAGPV